MFVCVVSLSQPSSKDLLYAKCLCVASLSQPSRKDLDYPHWNVHVPNKCRKKFFKVKRPQLLAHILDEAARTLSTAF